MVPKWSVRFSTNAGKQYERLRKSGVKPSINDIIDLLVMEQRTMGLKDLIGLIMTSYREPRIIVI